MQMYPFFREFLVNTQGNLIMAAAEIDFAIYLCSQKYNRKNERRKNLPICFSLMVTFYIRGSEIMLFSCHKFCCWWQNILLSIDSFWKLPFALHENCIYLLLHQYLFSIKQANKNCTLLSSHFLSVKIEFSSFVSDRKSYSLRLPIQILTSPDRAWLQWNFVVESYQTLAVIKKLQGNLRIACQPQSQCFSSPFIFFNLSGFSILLVNTCLLRGLFT